MISTNQMRELEDNCGISRLQLMENAGRGIFKILKEKFELKDKKVLVVANHGNNGGDGFVAARYLADICLVDVLFIGDESKFKEEAKINYKRIEKNKRIQVLYDAEEIDFEDYDIIIDAMLGTGTQGPLKEPVRSIIKQINSSKAFKLAIDIPSGLNPDTGEIEDLAIEADLIATFHDLKAGLEKHKDKTAIVDIGIKNGI